MNPGILSLAMSKTLSCLGSFTFVDLEMDDTEV